VGIVSEADSTTPNTTPATLRRGFRFRISTLLCVVALVAVVLGWCVNVVVPARHDVNASLCHSNLYKLFFALRMYDDVNGSLPPIKA
jgi:hypothetical protein